MALPGPPLVVEVLPCLAFKLGLASGSRAAAESWSDAWPSWAGISGPVAISRDMRKRTDEINDSNSPRKLALSLDTANIEVAGKIAYPPVRARASNCILRI